MPNKTEPSDNPLEAYATAIATLQELCHSRTHRIKMEAAQTLLQYVATPPTVEWDFEEIEDG